MIELSPQVLADLIGQSAYLAQHERRGSVRYHVCRPSRILLNYETGNTESDATTISEMSATGVRLIHPDALAAGQSFLLMLSKESGEAYTVECSVIRCARDAELGSNCHVIGAKLDRVFDGDILNCPPRRV